MINKTRHIVLDTETTGINQIDLPHINHRIIEIGAVEIINRRFTGNNFHVYIQPNRAIDPGALKIHGITNNFLSDKPLFKDISQEFLKYIKDSELIIHNASFDLGFINQEFEILNENIKNITTICSVIDTLKIARKLFPGKKNNLDALCIRYKIKKSHRNLHSAIIDAHLLGKLYLLMTGGQESIVFTNFIKKHNCLENIEKKFIKKYDSLRIVKANPDEIKLHKKYMQYIKEKKTCL